MWEHLDIGGDDAYECRVPLGGSLSREDTAAGRCVVSLLRASSFGAAHIGRIGWFGLSQLEEFSSALLVLVSVFGLLPCFLSACMRFFLTSCMVRPSDFII